MSATVQELEQRLGRNALIESPEPMTSDYRETLGALSLYMLLREFAESAAELTDEETFRDSYYAPCFLDRSLPTWSEFVTVNLFFEIAMGALLLAMRGSSTPLANRLDKMLEEERFHRIHGRDWFRRLASHSDRARQEMQQAVNRVWPETLCWFGTDRDTGASPAARWDSFTRPRRGYASR